MEWKIKSYELTTPTFPCQMGCKNNNNNKITILNNSQKWKRRFRKPTQEGEGRHTVRGNGRVTSKEKVWGGRVSGHAHWPYFPESSSGFAPGLAKRQRVFLKDGRYITWVIRAHSLSFNDFVFFLYFSALYRLIFESFRILSISNWWTFSFIDK